MMSKEEDLKTFYKTRYIYPAIDGSKLNEFEESNTERSQKKLYLPKLKKTSVIPVHTIYSSPKQSMTILGINRSIYTHMIKTINLQMISVYKTKIKTAIKSRKEFEFIHNHVHITPSRRQSVEEKYAKQRSTLHDIPKERNHIT